MILKSVLPWEARHIKGLRGVVGNFVPSCKEPLLDNYLQFLKTEKYDIAGIEFVISEDGNVYTYDVNSNTNYNSDAEEKSGFSIYDELGKYLQSQL